MIAGKAVGGPRAKYNEGSTGSAFCLSIHPGRSLTPQTPTSLQPGALLGRPPHASRRVRQLCQLILSTALLEGEEGCFHFAGEEAELQGDSVTEDCNQAMAGAGWRLAVGPGLPGRGSHPSRRPQETAGLCNEERGMGKVSVGFVAKKETDLPQ